MKLNHVVASLCVLGLVSGPAFANHHTKKHHTEAPKVEVRHDYKDYKDMGMKLCTMSATDKILIEANQNVGRSLPNPCRPGWFDRIHVSGGINIDAGKWGNRNANLMGENYQRLSLNDIYLNFDGNVNNWTKVFASINYMTATTMTNPAIYNSVGAAEYSAAYANNIRSTGMNTVQVEQAYGTFGNLNEYPVYLQVGKSFQDFSRYEIHPITRSLTQVLSETLATSAKLGFVAEGFNGGVYVFNDPITKIGSSASPTNYGVSLGYDYSDDLLNVDVGAGYMYNLIGANDVAYSVTNFTGVGGYNSRAGGVALFGDVNYGPFDFSLRYTQAVQRFNPLDLAKNGRADLTAGSLIGSGVAVAALPSATGAKPWAAGAQAGYGFEAWSMSQNVYLGYQASGEAAGLNMAKNRWLAGYGIEVVKDTSLGIEWDHDQQYSIGNGGLGNSTNLVSLRASAKFN